MLTEREVEQINMQNEFIAWHTLGNKLSFYLTFCYEQLPISSNILLKQPSSWPRGNPQNGEYSIFNWAPSESFK